MSETRLNNTGRSSTVHMDDAGAHNTNTRVSAEKGTRIPTGDNNDVRLHQDGAHGRTESITNHLSAQARHQVGRLQNETSNTATDMIMDQLSEDSGTSAFDQEIAAFRPMPISKNTSSSKGANDAKDAKNTFQAPPPKLEDMSPQDSKKDQMGLPAEASAPSELSAQQSLPPSQRQDRYAQDEPPIISFKHGSTSTLEAAATEDTTASDDQAPEGKIAEFTASKKYLEIDADAYNTYNNKIRNALTSFNENAPKHYLGVHQNDDGTIRLTHNKRKRDATIINDTALSNLCTALVKDPEQAVWLYQEIKLKQEDGPIPIKDLMKMAEVSDYRENVLRRCDLCTTEHFAVFWDNKTKNLSLFRANAKEGKIRIDDSSLTKFSEHLFNDKTQRQTFQSLVQQNAHNLTGANLSSYIKQTIAPAGNEQATPAASSKVETHSRRENKRIREELMGAKQARQEEIRQKKEQAVLSKTIAKTDTGVLRQHLNHWAREYPQHYLVVSLDRQSGSIMLGHSEERQIKMVDDPDSLFMIAPQGDPIALKALCRKMVDDSQRADQIFETLGAGEDFIKVEDLMKEINRINHQISQERNQQISDEPIKGAEDGA